MNKLIILILTFAITINFGFAQTNQNAVSALNIAKTVFDKKENAVNLEELKKLVIDDGADAQLAYERLIQAQKHIANARAQYFPYGIGTIASLYFFNSFSYLILAELITSLPGKIYTVQKYKQLRNAENHNLKATIANIKNQIANIYYNLLKEEALLKLSALELDLLREKIKSIEDQILLGLSTELALDDAKMKYYQVNKVHLRFKAYYLEERKALNLLLNRNFDMEPIELQPVGDFLSKEMIKMSTEKFSAIAVNRSNEIKAAEYMAHASKHNVSAEKLSILSFAGIGFGYMGRVRIAKSERRNAEKRIEFVTKNIENSVYTKKSKLLNNIEIFQQDLDLYETTKSYVEGDLAEYKVGQLTLGDLIDTELIYLADFREMIRTHYDSLQSLDDFERVVMGDVFLEPTNDSLIKVDLERKNKKVLLKVKSDLKNIVIISVRYVFERNLFYPMSSSHTSSDFSVSVKTNNEETLVIGQAFITLDNGEVITKNFKI